jgi:hypothetical protein
LDSLEQRKRLERIERSNSKMQLTKYSSIKYSKDSKKINDRSGTKISASRSIARKIVASTLRKGVRLFALTMPYKA